MSNVNTGKQGGAPTLSGNFSAGTPKPADAHAPKIVGASINFTGPTSTADRGKDGTSK